MAPAWQFLMRVGRILYRVSCWTVAAVQGWNPFFMVLYRSKQEMQKLSLPVVWTA